MKASITDVKLINNRVMLSARITTTREFYIDISISGVVTTLTQQELQAIWSLYTSNEIPVLDYREEK